MTSSDQTLSSFRQNFHLIFQTLAHFLIIIIASAALYFLGFYVVPVFAEKLPRSFDSESQVLAGERTVASMNDRSPNQAIK